MTPRFQDWQLRLQSFVAERLHAPFVWGQHDCCLFVCDAVAAITGHDPAADLRGYSTEQQAARIVKQGGGIAGLADARLGAAIAPALAQVGDAGLVVTEGRESLALCAGAHWLGVGVDGLKSLPIGEATRAWRAC